MKRIILLFAVLLHAIAAHGSVVTFNFSLLITNSTATAFRLVDLQPRNPPTVNGSLIVLGDKMTRTNDASGVLVVSNMAAGYFWITYHGPFTNTQFTIQVTNAASNYNAQDIIVTTVPSSYTYTTAVIDARFLQISNARAGTNMTIGTNNGVLTFNASISGAIGTNNIISSNGISISAHDGNSYISTNGNFAASSISTNVLTPGIGSAALLASNAVLIVNSNLTDVSNRSVAAKNLGTYPKTFTPDMLPNLAAWFKADALSMANGAVVSNWTDSSSNSRSATQSTNANRPTFNTNSLNFLPGITFATNSQLRTASFLDGTYSSVTVFMVGSRSTTNTGAAISDSSGSLSILRGANITNVLGFGQTAGLLATQDGTITDVQASTVSDTAPIITTFKAGSSTTILRVNGVTSSTAVSSTATPSGSVNIGGASTLGGFTPVNGWAGDINEIILFKSYLSDDDCRLVENYLASKWGLQKAQMIFDGDSQTSGNGATYNTSTYPYLINQGFSGTSLWDGENKGIGGITASTLLTNAPTHVDPSFRTPKDIVLFWAGINDLAVPQNSLTVLSTISNYCIGRRHVGFRVVVGTITPCAAAGLTATYETNRLALNGYIRSNWTAFADAIADVGGDPTIGVTNALTNTLYYNPDKVHLTDTGLAIAAGIFSNALLPLVVSPTNVYVLKTNGTAVGLTITGTGTNDNILVNSNATIQTGNISNLTAGALTVTNTATIQTGAISNGTLGALLVTNTATIQTGAISNATIGAETVTNRTLRTVTALGLTTNIDLSAGSHFTITLQSNTTLAFLNPPSAGIAQDVEIDVTVGAAVFTLTWANNSSASVFWPGGITPVQSTNSLMDRWNINFVGTNGHGAVLQRYTQ